MWILLCHEERDKFQGSSYSIKLLERKGSGFESVGYARALQVYVIWFLIESRETLN